MVLSSQHRSVTWTHLLGDSGIHKLVKCESQYLYTAPSETSEGCLHSELGESTSMLLPRFQVAARKVDDICLIRKQESLSDY